MSNGQARPALGAREEVERIVARIRARWPRTRIVRRADSGFAREDLMAWCEANRVDDLLGLAQNARLLAPITEELAAAKAAFEARGAPARRFKDFTYRTLDSWSRSRRVVGKAEHLAKGANPRFVVTSLKKAKIAARALYEDLYCARGEMENRIKECQLDLFADRTSAKTMRANQLRLWFSSFAYVLRLCPDRGPQALGPQAHPPGERHLRLDPPQALEDRRPGPRQRPAHPGLHGQRASLPERIRPGPRPPIALKPGRARKQPAGAVAGRSGLPARSEILLQVPALPPPAPKNPPTAARGPSQRQNRALKAEK